MKQHHDTTTVWCTEWWVCACAAPATMYETREDLTTVDYIAHGVKWQYEVLQFSYNCIAVMLSKYNEKLIEHVFSLVPRINININLLWFIIPLHCKVFQTYPRLIPGINLLYLYYLFYYIIYNDLQNMFWSIW